MRGTRSRSRSATIDDVYVSLLPALFLFWLISIQLLRTDLMQCKDGLSVDRHLVREEIFFRESIRESAFKKDKTRRDEINRTEDVAGIVVAAARPFVGAEVLLGADASAAAPATSSPGHGEKKRWRSG